MPAPEQRPLSSVNMPGFLGFALAAVAAIAAGSYLFGGKDEDKATPPRDPYDPSPPYNNGTSRNQTQQSSRPPQRPSQPPPPSSPYSHRPPATTNIHSQTTARTPAPPGYYSCACGAYHQRVVSPYTQSSNQTQPSIRTQASRPYSSFSDSVRAHESPGLEYTYTRTSSQTQPSARAQPSVRTQASRPYSSLLDSVDADEPPEYPHTRTSSQTRPSTRAQASSPYSSLYNSVDAHEPPEYGYSQTSSHVPPHVHTDSELAPVAISFVLLSDEPAGVEDLDFAKKLREQARRKGREMSEARSRVKSAQKKGSHGAAREHRQRANAHQSAMNELDKRAAEIIFKEKNKVCSYMSLKAVL